jgi:hypothetical protein
MEENGLGVEGMAQTPEDAARIVRHWVRAYGGVIESMKRGNLPFQITNIALKPPSRRLERQV